MYAHYLNSRQEEGRTTMTTMNKMAIGTYGGIVKQYEDTWWARCDQLPIATHRPTYTDAISSLVKSIGIYSGSLNGSSPPIIDAPPIDGAGVRFTLTIDKAS